MYTKYTDSVNYNLKMLWHESYDYYDRRPINGLAEYNGDKVYFTLKDEEILVDEIDYPIEVNNFINTYDPNEDNVDTENYYVYCIDDVNMKFEVYRKTSYSIYKMPELILKYYEEYMNELNDTCGYFNWHLPEMKNNISQKRA